jgi:hypothetical protein
MADVFMYQAELFCRECGEHLRATVSPISEDSDSYPQGPYPDGGGEADAPQHCGDCHEFLKNPLTPDGVAYVRRKLTEYATTGIGRDLVLVVWREFYDLTDNYSEEEQVEPLEEEEAAEYVPQWGSFMTSGDPGAIMYSKVPPEAPEHRDAMVRYIRGHCYPIADQDGKEETEDEYSDAQMLRRLVRYLLDLEF